MQNTNHWSVVLAGGEGTRMSGFIARWLGEPRPKQYCAFTGRRTMLEHTFDRALGLAAERQVVTIIGKGHRRYLKESSTDAPGLLIEQPRNCETGPGLFLALARIMASDPSALVAILPSDHFIYPREAFAGAMERALACAASARRPVLLSAVPDRPESDYGWIEPGRSLGKGTEVSLVGAFHEKPDAATADRLKRGGGYWSTMILAAPVSALWEDAWGCVPAMMARFEGLLELARRRGAEAFTSETLAGFYDGMPSVNFSRDILERCASRCLVQPLQGIDWCDWGRPERVTQTLRALGLRPAFEGVGTRELAAV